MISSTDIRCIHCSYQQALGIRKSYIWMMIAWIWSEFDWIGGHCIRMSSFSTKCVSPSCISKGSRTILFKLDDNVELSLRPRQTTHKHSRRIFSYIFSGWFLPSQITMHFKISERVVESLSMSDVQKYLCRNRNSFETHEGYFRSDASLLHGHTHRTKTLCVSHTSWNWVLQHLKKNK